MIDQCVELIPALWQEALVGGAVILVAAVVGAWVGGARHHWTVRIVAWWLARVVGPLLESRAWSGRAARIAANNSLICAAVVCLGALGHVAWLAVVCVGMGLGIALRLMSSAIPDTEDHAEDKPAMPRRPVLEAMGFVLNALEIPAIMLAAGLSLGQGAMSATLHLSSAMAIFGLVVVPLLVVSAAGEALWMGLVPDLPHLTGLGRMGEHDAPSQS
jgi:hypothetical protein